jgi:hypothetical protein
MTPELIHTWCLDWQKEVQSLAARMSSVQTPAEMTDALDAKVQHLNAVADRVYGRWIAGLERKA